MLALAMPVMQLFLLGYGVNLDISHVPVCVYDQEGSQFSQSLFKRVQASPYFQIVRSLHGEGEIKQVMDDGTCRMVLVSALRRAWALRVMVATAPSTSTETVSPSMRTR